MISRRVLSVGAMALALGFAPALMAQPGPPADDASLKAPEVIAFMGLKPGDKVADIVAGRMIRAEATAVGPTGKVYAVEPAEVVKEHPEILDQVKAGAAANPAIVLINQPINQMALPSGLDAVFIRQNYHDLYDKFMGPADVPKFNKAVFAALKPGGVFVILDHAAAAGSGLRDTDTIHRIDPARVKTDMTAAGFVFDGESKVLANPADDHTKMVFDPAIRGKTDQFLYRFRKPK
ncbi:MAG: methyltransferase [Caulobacteraceae bacterium]|nr:methyltransferase [Caulobacteraceae bacterium]